MKNLIIILVSVMIAGCSQYTGKNVLISDNDIESRLQGDWSIDSIRIDDKTSTLSYEKIYSFINGRFYTIVGNDVKMSKYKIKNNNIKLFSKRKVIDEAEVLHLSKTKLVLKTGYYYYDIRTIFLSR